MNCKPGDLAIIVRSAMPSDPDLGKIVRVIEIAEPYEGDQRQFWVFDTLGQSLHAYLTQCGEEFAFVRVPVGAVIDIADPNLRAIRDPGEDAKDEMLRPLPKEVEHA